MAPTFESYIDFVHNLVQPLKTAHPEWRRMDGLASGGNRSVVAYLNHEGRLFCVHGDAWITSLLAPYEALKRNVSGPLLVVAPTRGGKREKLTPSPGAGSDKGFYVYQYP